MTIRIAGVVVFLAAVGTVMPTNGQALSDATILANSEALGRGSISSERPPAGDAAAGTYVAAIGLPSSPSTPAEIRSRLLYSDSKFSTFQHRPAEPEAHRETRIRPDSLDRRTDRWFALDKAKHVTFSFLWTLSTQYVVVNKGRISEHHALPLSITSGAAIGVSKEYYDLTIAPSRYFSVKDLVADAVGILLATGVILL